MDIAQGRDLSLILLSVEAGLFVLVVGVIGFFAIQGVRQVKVQVGRGLRWVQKAMDDTEVFITRYARSPFALVVPLAGLIYRLFQLSRSAVARFGRS